MQVREALQIQVQSRANARHLLRSGHRQRKSGKTAFARPRPAVMIGCGGVGCMPQQGGDPGQGFNALFWAFSRRGRVMCLPPGSAVACRGMPATAGAAGAAGGGALARPAQPARYRPGRQRRAVRPPDADVGHQFAENRVRGAATDEKGEEADPRVEDHLKIARLTEQIAVRAPDRAQALLRRHRQAGQAGSGRAQRGHGAAPLRR